MIVVYGFRISVSFNDSEALEKSKKGIVWCLTGLVVITFAYVIVKTVVSIAFLGQDTEIWIEMKWAEGTELGAASSDKSGYLAIVDLVEGSGAISLNPEVLNINIATANDTPLQCSISDDDFCFDGVPTTTTDLGRLIMATSVTNNRNYTRIEGKTVKIKQCPKVTIDKGILTSEVKVECKQEVNNTTAEGALYFRVNKHSFCSRLPDFNSKTYELSESDLKIIAEVREKLNPQYTTLTNDQKTYQGGRADEILKKVPQVGDGEDNNGNFFYKIVAEVQGILKYYKYYSKNHFTEHMNKFSPGTEVTEECKQVDGFYGPCTRSALEAWCTDPNSFSHSPIPTGGSFPSGIIPKPHKSSSAPPNTGINSSNGMGPSL